MLEKFRQSISSGVMEWVKPKKLVEAINTCCRLVSEVFMRHDGIINKEYSCTGVRNLYSCVSIPLSSIQESTAIAGGGNNIGISTVAGRGDGSFFVLGLPEGVIAISKSPDSDALLLYRDFVPHAEGYIFNVNPSKYGTVSTAVGESVITFFYVGGPVRAKVQPQFKHIYGNTKSTTTVNAVNTSMTTALCLAGFSNATVNAAAGVDIVTVKGSVTDTAWCEGSNNYVGIGGAVYKCPRSMPISIEDTTADDVRGLPVTDKHMRNTLVLPIGGAWYWLDGKRIDHTALPNTLYSEYPVSAGDINVMQQLAAILATKHMCTVDGTESGNEDNKVLAKYLPCGNFVHLIRHIDIDMSTGVTTGDKEDVNTLYILYSDGGNNIIKPGTSVREMLHSVNSHRGALRITGCVNKTGVLYAISANATVTGKRLTQSAKIYGVVAVIGGKRPEDDVVYSYKNVNNESFGAGLEVVVTALL